MVTADLVYQGRAAFERNAWGEAYAQLSAAAELAAEDLERLAVAAYLTGQVDAAAQAWERAHHAFLDDGATDRAVRCGLWLGMTLLLRGEPARGGGWIGRATRLLDDASPDCVERGYVLLPAAWQALEIDRDPAAAHATFGEIGEIAQRFGEPDLLALSRMGRGQALVLMGTVTQGMAMLDEAMVAVTTGEVSPVPAGLIYCTVITVCWEIFDLRRAHEWTAALSRWCATQQDLKPYRGQCLVHRSEIMQLRGEWADAFAEVQQACEHLSDPPGDPVMGMALYQQGELLRLRGELAQAEEAYRRAGDWGHPVHPGLAMLRLAQGRVGDAQAALRRVVEEAEDDRARRSRVLAAQVEITLAAGDVGAARAAADELAHIADEFGSPYLRAVAAYAGGAVLLAEDDAAAACAVLRRAWRSWQELSAPYEAARVRLLVAQACQQLGDNDTAEMELDAARRVFEQLGASPALALVGQLSRAEPSRQAGGLSPREVEVLHLVAGGASNRDIAATLVISEHTARRHLQNIFGKIDVSSRAAATAYAYEHGLV